MIDFQKKKLMYYDSVLGRPPRGYFDILEKYVKDEARTYSSRMYDMASWTREVPSNMTLQDDGCNCGVFMLTYAKNISEERTLNFSQTSLPNLRMRLCNDILNKHIS